MSAGRAVAAVLASTAPNRTQVVPTQSTPLPHTQDQAHLAAEESTPSAVAATTDSSHVQNRCWYNNINANPLSLISSKPQILLKGLRHQKKAGFVYYDGNEKKIGPISTPVLHKKVCTFIRQLASLEYCINVHGKRTTCQCMHNLQDMEDKDLNPIVSDLLNYHALKNNKAYQM